MRKLFFGLLVLIIIWIVVAKPNFQQVEWPNVSFVNKIKSDNLAPSLSQMKEFLSIKHFNTSVKSAQEISNVETEMEEEKDDFNGNMAGLIVLVNKERFDRELKPLKKNNLLMSSAKQKAEDMIKNKYFEHISGEHIQPWVFAEISGYRYQTFGENIANEYLSINSVHKAFMDSVGHRQNILNKNFRDIGVAIMPFQENEQQKYLVVEHFGSYLKDINVNQEKKYTEKIRLRCKIQKKKKKEVIKMIKYQKDNKLTESILPKLKTIEQDIDNYLKECQKIKEGI